MGAPLYRCPVCLHSSFSSVTALWQGLMSGASRRLSCPICQEVLLGLDKLTLHLYSHLPVSSNSSSMSPQQENANSVKKHTVAHEFPQSVVSAELLKSRHSNSLEEPSQIPRNQVNTNNSLQVNFMNPQFHNVTSPNKCNENNSNEQSTLSWDSNSAILSSSEENKDKSPKLNIEFNPISYGSVEHQQQQFSNKPEDLLFSADVPPPGSNNDDQGTYSNANDPNPQKQISTVINNATMFQLSLGELNVDTDIHSVLKSTDSEHQVHNSSSGTTSCLAPKEIVKESLVPVTTPQSSLPDTSSKKQNKYICYSACNANPELQCGACGAAFATLSLLAKHTQLVHPAPATNDGTSTQPEEPTCSFACHLCNRRFKMRGSLMVHVRFVHGGLRLVKAAKGLRGPSQLDQTLQQPVTSASPPSNSSPEPLFPSLSELSEQLSASPSQTSLPNSSANTQVDVLNSHESVSIEMEESDDVEFDNTEVMHSNTGNTMKNIDDNNFSAHQWQEPRDVIDTEKDTISANLVQETTQWMSSPLKCVLAPVNNTDFRSQHTSNERQDWPNQHTQDTLKYSQQNSIQTEMNSGKQKVESMKIASKMEFCRKEQERISPENNSAKEKDGKLNTHSVAKSSVNNDLNKAYECEVCFKRFTTKYFHKKHQRLHTGERPYTCGTCGKTFAFQQSFHKHLLYHTSAKPHSCAECGQAFKELSTLHNHQRIHTGERPFVCETCGKAFRQRVSYLVHRRIHTGVLPYKCSACNKSFRYKVSQRTHKCQAQPPGNVIRQSELVQRLLMKAASSLPDVADNASSSAVAMAAGNMDGKSSVSNSLIPKEASTQESSRASNFPPLLTINEESLHQLLAIFPN